VLREFTSKRHVKLSRVRIKAKDEVGEEEAKKNPRRRGASSSGERKESDRSLAKVLRLGLLQHENRRISSVPLNQNEPFPRSHLLGRRARSYVAHSLTYPSLQVMRQAEEEAVPEPHEPCHADRPRGAGAAARGGHRPAVRTAMEARATEHRRRVTLPAPLHPVRSGRWKSTQRQQLRLCEIASCKTDSVL
jgi:hypothetical protein